MQKVITITTHTKVLAEGEQIYSTEYPTINAYLNDGYRVVQIVPVANISPTSFKYTLTFVLEK